MSNNNNNNNTKKIELVNVFKHRSSLSSMRELHVLPEEPITKQRL
jgi:hypothetical protein